MFSLFKTEPIATHQKDEGQQIADAIKAYEDVQFSFNPSNGKLFLVGHVLTTVDKNELLYILNNLSFIDTIEDNVVVDEYVWQNMNALLMTNPDWQGVTVQATSPGHFVLRGYLQTLDQAQALSDYVNMNFPYLDRLENQVVVEKNLTTEIQGQLIEKGFSAVTFELSNGELVLSGRVDGQHGRDFNELVTNFKALRGIRVVKNFVIYTTADSSRIDLSTQYQITGYSKKDDVDFFVVISGKILSKGDSLDGMTITSVQPNIVLLEKDGLKFKINYNQQ
jgi:type III secretion system YscD/HrpQ family protein